MVAVSPVQDVPRVCSVGFSPGSTRGGRKRYGRSFAGARADVVRQILVLAPPLVEGQLLYLSKPGPKTCDWRGSALGGFLDGYSASTTPDAGLHPNCEEPTVGIDRLHYCSQGLHMKNPFRPTAGATPPEVLGRTGLLDRLGHSLDTRSNAPAFLIVGGRGIGKTVMLGQAESVARSRGWRVITETATAGFADRMAESVRRLPVAPDEKFRLVVTVDEIHAADHAEVAQLAATVQNLSSDGLAVRLVVAGLPAAVADLLKEDSAAFLRRAGRIELRHVAVADVESSFARTFVAAGFDVSPGDVRRAADATAGYPFLIQIVGYFLWQDTEKARGAFSAAVADRAIARAFRWHSKTVLQSALSGLSAQDMDFLRALAADAGPSTDDFIERQTGAVSSEVSDCRSRLMDARLIEAHGQNLIGFAVPRLCQYIRQVARAGQAGALRLDTGDELRSHGGHAWGSSPSLAWRHLWQSE